MHVNNGYMTWYVTSQVSASILRNITIIDTPGVLAGEKQRIGRDYDFTGTTYYYLLLTTYLPTSQPHCLL